MDNVTFSNKTLLVLGSLVCYILFRNWQVLRDPLWIFLVRLWYVLPDYGS